MRPPQSSLDGTPVFGGLRAVILTLTLLLSHTVIYDVGGLGD